VRGIFADMPYCLVRMDWELQNMLADAGPAPSGPMLTGILDWARARFAPAFMVYRPSG
jgi:hypothetical protein